MTPKAPPSQEERTNSVRATLHYDWQWRAFSRSQDVVDHMHDAIACIHISCCHLCITHTNIAMVILENDQFSALQRLHPPVWHSWAAKENIYSGPVPHHPS